ncbi:sulfotransferase [Poseidonocella sp. HB161398]|uniref:sulfotransferase n=1 Tax=Poseidonocella sp. HB161398 TaxID=2320855 RepID=UPI00110810FA|nr:sulfotransferase [Poseidonocella sp. HB161398]
MEVVPTTLPVFENAASRGAAEKTFVIFGGRRGGTTAVAGVCQRLGLHLGDNLETNLEDLVFRKETGIEEIAEAIAERNAARPVWGWKHPTPHAYLKQIVPNLRNPRFIVVSRDTTAHAAGMLEREERDIEESLRLHVRTERQNLDFVFSHQLPTLFVSYEKLVVKPAATIKELADFLGAEVTSRKFREIGSFIHPGYYEPVDRSGKVKTRIKQFFRRTRAMA